VFELEMKLRETFMKPVTIILERLAKWRVTTFLFQVKKIWNNIDIIFLNCVVIGVRQY
jgi:hypothetical protein